MADADADDQPDLAELSKSVDSIKDDLDELQDLKSKLNDVLDAAESGQELQGDTFAIAQDLIERAETEGFDSSEQTVAGLIQFAQGEMDLSDEELQALQEAADAMLQAEDADSLDAVSAEALLSFAAEHAGGGGEEEPPEDDEDTEMSELEDELRELREQVDELAQQPTPPRVGVSEDTGEEERPLAAPVYGGIGRDGDYVTR